MPAEFKNEPLTDFTKPENRKLFEAALARVEAELGREHPLVIGGEKVRIGKTFDSINPACPTQIIGRFQAATTREADLAIAAAERAFETWGREKAEKRADLLFRTAAILRDRKHEFSAWMVLEVGKSWAEADGDTAEAIDFCEFYASEALRYASERRASAANIQENLQVPYQLPAYLVLDLVAMREWGPHALHLRVDNVLNLDDAEPGFGGIDLSKRGRYVVLGYRYAW